MLLDRHAFDHPGGENQETKLSRQPRGFVGGSLDHSQNLPLGDALFWIVWCANGKLQHFGA